MTMKTPDYAEFVYYIAADGEEYLLFGGNRVLLSMSNTGRPEIDYLSDQGPFQHGVTVRDFRYQPRTVTLRLFEAGCERQDWHCHLAELLDTTRPNRSQAGGVGSRPGKLLVVRPDYKEVETPARIMRGPAGDWNAQGSTRPADVNEVLQFLCETPFWNETAVRTEVSVLDVFDSCLSMCLPACLGGNIINETFDITYCGTWQGDVMTIALTGPLTTPTITNSVTGKQIRFGRAIAAGERVTITIAPGVVTAVNNFGQNVKGFVSNLSDLTTFNLIPASDLAPGGVNRINVSAAGGADGVSGFSITYLVRHESAFAPCVECS